jgi:hypothetical protein
VPGAVLAFKEIMRGRSFTLLAYAQRVSTQRRRAIDIGIGIGIGIWIGMNFNAKRRAAKAQSLHYQPWLLRSNGGAGQPKSGSLSKSGSPLAAAQQWPLRLPSVSPCLRESQPLRCMYLSQSHKAHGENALLLAAMRTCGFAGLNIRVGPEQDIALQ